MAHEDDQKRLYLWVRVFGAVMLLFALVITALAFVLLPAINPDYDVGDGTAAAVLGTLAASALALVGVQLRLWRNGNGER